MFRLLIILFLASIKLSAQPNVTRTIINGNDDWNFLTSVIKVDDEFYVSGYSADQSTMDNVLVSKINSSGEVVWSRENETETVAIAYDITFIGNNNFIIASTKVERFGSLALSFDLINENGILLNNIKLFTDDSSNYEGLRAEYINNSDYIVTARTVRNITTNNCTVPMVVKFTNDFNTITAIEIASLDNFGCFEIRDVKYFSDAEIIISAFEHQDSSELKLFSFNINQQLNWEATIDYEQLNRTSFIKKDLNENIIIAGFSENENEEYSTFLQRYSNQGELIEDEIINHLDTTIILNSGFMREDGNFILLHNIFSDLTNSDIRYTIFDNEFNIIKYQDIALDEMTIYEEGRDIILTEDGDIAITGATVLDNSGNQNGLFVLTNCDILNSTSESEEEPNVSSTIYPNPIDDYLIVELSNNELFNVEIYSIDGMKLYTQKHKRGSLFLNDLKLNPGSYYLKILSKNEFVIHKFIVK